MHIDRPASNALRLGRMEKISAEAKKRYSEKIKEYKQTVEEILAHAKQLDSDIRQAGSELPETEPNLIRLDLADQYLNLVSYYILMSALSLSLLGIKNEGYLNDARKTCYKAVICLEEIVTSYVDSPFSDYEDKLASLDGADDSQKYNLVRKMGFSIESVIDGFGENSKWKWSFVELRGRYAVISKNLINLKTFIVQMDPRVEGYYERQAHLDLAKRLLQNSADGYREKYELSTLRLDDIKQAILFLSALRRFHVLLGESDESEIIKKKMEVWKAKMDSDQKKQEMTRKMEKLKNSQNRGR